MGSKVVKGVAGLLPVVLGVRLVGQGARWANRTESANIEVVVDRYPRGVGKSVVRIFVSYRRSDTQGEASHLVADLRRRYGDAAVFMDLTTIGPGEDFAQVIERALQDCAVVLVLLGRRWLDVLDSDGQRRLDHSADLVRQELKIALSKQIRIVPLVVQGASMPAAGDLPEELRPLLRHNAHELSAKRWDYDFGRLAEVIDREVPQIVAVPSRSPKSLWLGVGAAATVALASIVWFAWPPARPDRATIAGPTPSTSPRAFFGAGQGAVDTDKVASFLALTAELAKRPELGKGDLQRVAAAQFEACPQGFMDACSRTVDRAVSAMLSEFCTRQAGPEPAKDDDAASLRHGTVILSCIQKYSVALMNEQTKSAVRVIKPG